MQTSPPVASATPHKPQTTQITVTPSGYYPERSALSPYDVSLACQQIHKIDGMMTTRQTVEVLERVLQRTDPGTDIYRPLMDLVKAMRVAIRAAA